MVVRPPLGRRGGAAHASAANPAPAGGASDPSGVVAMAVDPPAAIPRDDRALPSLARAPRQPQAAGLPYSPASRSPLGAVANIGRIDPNNPNAPQPFDPNIPRPQIKTSPVDPSNQSLAQSPADSEVVVLLSENERMALLEKDGRAGDDTGAN